jgi:hypothetical protein
MQSVRRTLALSLGLAVSLGGCFDSHRGDPSGDAGRRVDGAAPTRDSGGAICEELPASGEEIVTCEVDPTGDAFAVVRSTPALCCSSGTTSATVVTRPGELEVMLSWTACECCRGCRCVGPLETTRVSLGHLAPGTYQVLAGASRCSLTVEPPAECRSAPAEGARHARVLFEDQTFAATVTAHGGGSCGCAPRVAPIDRHAISLELELCDCCDACECIDPGYEASLIEPPLPIGRHEIVIPHGVATIDVTTRDRCRSNEPTGLRIVAPDPSRLQGSPRLTWAVVSGIETLCCVAPAPAVGESIGPGGERALSLYSCVQEDCDCVGSPVESEAWHSLGELGPGTHVIRAGAHSATIEIPADG